jgi:hypothetical protein
MKFSSALLFAAALCSVQQASAAMTAEQVTAIQLGQTDYTDQFKIVGTLDQTIGAASEVVVVTLPDAFATTFASADGSYALNTDYTIKCDGSALSPATAAVSGGSQKILSITLDTNNQCATTKVLEITFLKVKFTPPGPIPATTGMLSVTGTAAVAAQTGLTPTPIKKGTFATITAASLKVSSTAGTTFTDFELKFTATILGVNSKFTVVVPGYTLKDTNQCTLAPADSTTAPTVAATSSADSSPWEFTLLTQAFTAQEYTLKCDKVLSPAAQAANKAAVIIGDTEQSLILLGTFALPAVTAPAAPFSAAPASAGGSMAALVLGSFAALCLLF